VPPLGGQAHFLNDYNYPHAFLFLIIKTDDIHLMAEGHPLLAVIFSLIFSDIFLLTFHSLLNKYLSLSKGAYSTNDLCSC
jgi:hypothetical protein